MALDSLEPSLKAGQIFYEIRSISYYYDYVTIRHYERKIRSYAFSKITHLTGYAPRYVT